MSALDELLGHIEISAFPEKTSKLSTEIARLMREGGAEGRKKAQELLQAAMTARSTDEKGSR